MSLFQPSVLKSYLKQLNTETLNTAWNTFTAHFHNPVVQAKIRERNEVQYQTIFLLDLFVNVLGYTMGVENANLIPELKNVSDKKTADGAVLNTDGKVLAVIELKGTNTTNLDKVQEQAFRYMNNHNGCKYVIISNYEKLRFYISKTNEYLEFNLFTLTREQFNLLWLCIAKESIFTDLPFKVKQDTVTNEAAITKKLYKDYQSFRSELFNSLVELNEQYDKMLLFKKTQKLLDRFLFIFFAEDRQLLPANSISKIVKNYKDLKELDFPKPLYEVFKQYFHFINTGRKKTETKAEIFPYNGGLFKTDEVLDNLKINDSLLLKHALKLTAYDFESEVSVNILGHIFEHSLNDLEEMQAQIEGTALDTKQTKRKKDGVFYTPQYITQYIVENTVGKLCEEKKTELNFEETEYTPNRTDKKGNVKAKSKTRIKQLLDVLKTYRTWLTQITICDPACGSGAFLNEALQFLMKEHKYLDELETNLLGGGFVFPNVEKTILENNLFGVDINNESVEIAKLSLWLSTAAPNRKLSSLNNNIKCGNSLIDSVEVAGEKAFNWQTEFPTVFKPKDKQAFHVVITTHNSRTSQRMIDYKVEKGEPIELNLKQEIALTTIIGNIITESNFNCLAYNVCKDHVHLILVCAAEELSQQVKTIKGKSAYLFNRLKPDGQKNLNDNVNGLKPDGENPNDNVNELKPDEQKNLNDNVNELKPDGQKNLNDNVNELKADGENLNDNVNELKPDDGKSMNGLKSEGEKSLNGFQPIALWSQKFFKANLNVWELNTGTANGYAYGDTYIDNAINYIQTNRQKHELPASEKLEKAIKQFVITPEKAFTAEYGGGFDVVIGNPPYGIVIDKKEESFYKVNYPLTNYKINLYILFIEKMIYSFPKSIVQFIIPKSLLFNSFYDVLRNYLLNNVILEEILTISEKVFEDAEVGGSLIIKFKVANPDEKPLENNIKLIGLKSFKDYSLSKGVFNTVKQKHFTNQPKSEIVISSNQDLTIKDKILNLKGIKEFYILKNGLNPGNVKHIIISDVKETEKHKPIIWGKEISKYSIDWNGSYVNYDNSIRNKIDVNDIKSKKGMRKQIKIDFALRSIEIFETPKILIRKTGDSLISTIDKENYFYDTLVHGIIKKDNDFSIEYLVAILNSKPATYFYRILHDIKGKVFAKISLTNLADFPIPKPSKQQRLFLEEKAETMLQLNKTLNQKKNQFLKLLQANFEIEKLSKKLQAYYNFDFKTLVAELKKKKIIFSLAQQAEWMDFFEQSKTEINALQSQIAQTDKTIDAMVYQLYGLTPEEIAIVEAAV